MKTQKTPGFLHRQAVTRLGKEVTQALTAHVTDTETLENLYNAMYDLAEEAATKYEIEDALYWDLEDPDPTKTYDNWYYQKATDSARKHLERLEEYQEALEDELEEAQAEIENAEYENWLNDENN